MDGAIVTLHPLPGRDADEAIRRLRVWRATAPGRERQENLPRLDVPPGRWRSDQATRWWWTSFSWILRNWLAALSWATSMAA